MIQNNANTLSFARRIGGTTYRVNAMPGEHASGSLEDKLLRLIRNEVLAFGETCDMMNVPQMSRQSGRSA